MAAAAAAAPGRSLEYAESTDRLVYAFLFGSTDTCRVIRRREAPRFDFETALPRTVAWYLSQDHWLQRVRSGAYQEYYARQYGGQ